MMDYTVSRSFPLLSFLLHQSISPTSLDQFLSFTDNFMVVSFEDIISKNAFDIMKLADQVLKLGNVLQVFLFNIMLEIRLIFLNIFLNFVSI